MHRNTEHSEEKVQAWLKSFGSRSNDYQAPTMRELSYRYFPSLEFWYSDENKWIDIQSFVEVEPSEVVEVEPQEVVEVEPKEVVQVESQEVVEVEPKEVVEVEPKEVMEVESQEVVEVEPKEIVEIFPDICLVERVNEVSRNANKVKGIQLKKSIAISTFTGKENQDSRRDQSILDLKWYDRLICNNRYTNENLVSRYDKKAHDLIVPTVETPEISVKSSTFFNNNCASKTTEKDQLTRASSSADKGNMENVLHSLFYPKKLSSNALYSSYMNLENDSVNGDSKTSAKSAFYLEMYYCWICDKKYMHKSSLRHHQRKVHDFKGQAIKPPEITTCGWCLKQFYDVGLYKKHRKSHVKLTD